MDLGTCIVHYEGRANLEVDSLFIKLDLIFFFLQKPTNTCSDLIYLQNTCLFLCF